jgi:hypothetical protein
MLENDFRDKWNELKSIASLAEFFGASIASTAVRVQRLGIRYGKQ